MGRTINKAPTAKNDYIVCLIMILVDVFLVCGLYWIFGEVSHYTDIANWNYGFSFGGMVALGVQASYYVAGGLKNSFGVVALRWSDFFANLSISFKFAIISLFENFKEEGIAFVCYILVSLATLNVSIHGFMYFIELYGINF